MWRIRVRRTSSRVLEQSWLHRDSVVRSNNTVCRINWIKESHSGWQTGIKWDRDPHQYHDSFVVVDEHFALHLCDGSTSMNVSSRKRIRAWSASTALSRNRHRRRSKSRSITSSKAKSTALLDNKITTAQKGKRYCCRHHRHHKLVTRKRCLAIEVPTATGGGGGKEKMVDDISHN
jgi:hypothetical protein